MKPIKIFTIFGTRPEAIKLAPVIKQLETEEKNEKVKSLTCVTGQHRELVDQMLHQFDIRPDYDLNLMKPSQSPLKFAAAMMTRLDSIMKKEQPDWILVQGDTTTVMAASITAFYNKIKIGHVEAGLRSGDKWQPFPEEINRKIAGVVADLHFAPTTLARQNLLNEGIPEAHIQLTGNTIIDALHIISAMDAHKDASDFFQTLGLNGKVGEETQKILLVTAHRRENFGAPLVNICLALEEIAERYKSLKIVYPVHLNPNVWRPVHEKLGKIENIRLIPPLDYFMLIQLMKRSYFILTDSGGIQEEAPGLGKPVLVLRNVTERPEGVQAGVVKLVGTDRDQIVRASVNLLENTDDYFKMARAENPYGDGKASKRIVEAVKNYPN